MKQLKTITLLTALAIILGGCSNEASPSNSDVSSSTSTSGSSATSEEGSKASWSDEAKEKMLDYLGEVLPYPEGFVGEVTVEEYSNYGDSTYLSITDQAEVFSIKTYYEELESAGWTAIRDYNNNPEIITESGGSLFECVKLASSESTGFDLQYYYNPGEEASEDWDAEPGGNQIIISKECASVSTEPYSDEDTKTFKNVLTQVPPQLKLAEEYSVSETGNINYLTITDDSVLDLRKDNVEILKGDGYKLNTTYSEAYNVYVLVKSNDDKSSIVAYLDFYEGNYIIFEYVPNVETYTSWPDKLDDDLVDKYDAVIPEFKDENVDTYKAFVKNGQVFIYQEKVDVSSLSSKIVGNLVDAGLVCDNYGSYFYDFDERYFVAVYSDNDTFIGITFGEKEKEHSFVTGYTELASEISTFLESKEITGTLPSLSKVDELSTVHKNFRVEKEEDKLTFAFFDASTRNEKGDIVNPIKEYLAETFKNALWYGEGYGDCELNYENADGSIYVGVNSMTNLTMLVISQGSGEEHPQVFSFGTKKGNMSPGQSADIELKVSMLPDTYTIESDNELVTVDHDGWVEVDSTIEVGTVVTITASFSDASLNVDPITCTITITQEYTKESAVEEATKLYATATGETAPEVESTVETNEYDGYSETTYTYSFTVTSSSTTTIEEAEKLVDEKLIPLGFEILEGEDWTEEVNEDGITVVKKQFSFYSLYPLTEDVQLYFYLYKDADNNIVIQAKTSYTEYEETYSDDEDDDDWEDDEDYLDEED